MTLSPDRPQSGGASAGGKTVEGDGDAVRLALAEEQLVVTTQPVVTGRVRVRTLTDTIEEVVRHPLDGERIEVRHVPRDVVIAPGEPLPQMRQDGDVTILPVFEEVLVVETRLVLKEELHIIRRPTSEMAEIPVALRRQRATVERLEGDDPSLTPNLSPSIHTEQDP
jgi:stress response protein YsnF